MSKILEEIYKARHKIRENRSEMAYANRQKNITRVNALLAENRRIQAYIKEKHGIIID